MSECPLTGRDDRCVCGEPHGYEPKSGTWGDWCECNRPMNDQLHGDYE